jgi:hypothetical protein
MKPPGEDLDDATLLRGAAREDERALADLYDPSWRI